jgi:hypothetical protein
MDRLRKAALLTTLIQKLREQGSWSGETHVQKGIFILQELMEVPLEFDFILYKHGPFSFDLRDELTALRADELLSLERQPWPYGPRLAPTERSVNIQSLFSKTVATFENQINFVALKLGGKGVTELERLATALYVTREGESGPSVDERAERLVHLKPHVSLTDARDAIIESDRMSAEAKEHLS